MAEKFLQNRMYEYTANSNLVLESDHRRRPDEPKGEVETLRGRVHKIKMGERVGAKNTSQDPELQQAKRQKLSVNVAEKTHTKKADSLYGGNKNILSSAEEMSYNYLPKSAECVVAYEELLLYTQALIGDQPSEVLKSAANEILSILKDGHHDNNYKQKEISKLLSTQIQNFGDLLRMSNRITDYKNVSNMEEQENQPVVEDMAVVFDDEEDERLGADEDEDDDDEEIEDARGPLQGAKLGDDDMMNNAKSSYSDLSIYDIDAYWLQRQLSKYYSDANTSSKLAEETLNILANPDERVCENKLVFLLEFDKFDLIKKLLKHRAKIYYCTKLKQAQSESERSKIETEMQADTQNGGADILRLIQEKSSIENRKDDLLADIAKKAKKETNSMSGNSERGMISTNMATIH
jgi:pre-mRNA-splicing helicase BRR2